MSEVQKYVKGMPVAVGQVVEFSNGAHAEKQANGRFKIVKGPNAAGLAKLHASPRRSKKYSVKGAKNVMGRHYNKKSYKSREEEWVPSKEICAEKTHLNTS